MSVLRDHIKPWTDYLRVQAGHQASGVENYRRSAELFLVWADGNDISADPSAITRADIDAFLKYLFYDKGNIKNSSRANKLAGVRSFFKYLVYVGVITESPVEGVPSPKPSKGVPTKFTTEELQFIFAAPDISTQMGLRDLAMMMTTYAAGLRGSEICKLQIKHVIDKGGVGYIRLNIIGAKGDKSRTLTLRTTPAQILRAWLTIRLTQNAKPEDYVFVRLKGGDMEHLSTQTLNNILKKYSTDLGMNSRSFMHKLRTTFATDLYDSGRDKCVRCGHAVETVDLLEIMYLMGHDDPKTTRLYIAQSEKVLTRTAIPDRRFKELLKKEGDAQ